MGNYLQTPKIPSVERSSYCRIKSTAKHQVHHLPSDRDIGNAT